MSLSGLAVACWYHRWTPAFAGARGAGTGSCLKWSFVLRSLATQSLPLVFELGDPETSRSSTHPPGSNAPTPFVEGARALLRKQPSKLLSL